MIIHKNASTHTSSLSNTNTRLKATLTDRNSLCLYHLQVLAKYKSGGIIIKSCTCLWWPLKMLPSANVWNPLTPPQPPCFESPPVTYIKSAEVNQARIGQLPWISTDVASPHVQGEGRWDGWEKLHNIHRHYKAKKIYFFKSLSQRYTDVIM